MKGITLGDAPKYVMLLVVIALLFGSGLIAVQKFTDSLNDNTAVNTSAELGMGNLTVSITNFASMFPTIGTILGIAVLIIAILAAFMWAFGKFGGPGKKGGSIGTR